VKTGAPIPADLRALRIGDVALVTVPGEIFAETGMAIKERSPFSRTLFAAYSNGSIGYVPVHEAWAGADTKRSARRFGPVERKEETALAPRELYDGG
jgi:hypothetical protein